MGGVACEQLHLCSVIVLGLRCHNLMLSPALLAVTEFLLFVGARGSDFGSHGYVCCVPE